jgi:hypothetical protein
MIDTLEAEKEALLKHLNENYRPYSGKDEDDVLVILEEYTITKDYGWIFFYDRKKYLESGSISDLLIGGGPIVVLKDGTIEGLVSYLPVEQAIEQYEQSRESN